MFSLTLVNFDSDVEIYVLVLFLKKIEGIVCIIISIELLFYDYAISSSLTFVISLKKMMLMCTRVGLAIYD